MTDPACDTDGPSGNRATTGEALPVWSLDDLYRSPDDPALRKDLEGVAADAARFAERWAGKIAVLAGNRLADAIEAYERIDERMGRLSSYAQLLHAGDRTDPRIGRFYQTVTEKLNDASARLVFFALEIDRIEEERLEALYSESARLRSWQPWLRDIRTLRNHRLSDDLERLLHDKRVVGRNAWNRLFDETVAALRFPIDGEDLTEAEALHRLSSPDRNVREAAGHALAAVFNDNIGLFSHIANTLAKDKKIEDRWRRYDRPVSARNRANRIEDEVVDALVEAVRAAYPRLSHRYYAMKAGWLGLDRLKYWDRNAPLPDIEEPQIGWQDAEAAVLSAYRAFSPELAEIGSRFFAGRWIDAAVRPGKSSGAFSHPCVPSVHPYILTNFQGKVRDAMTLAHELGHGVHQVLAGAQGHLRSQTPLTLAETASVFGEMLTFRALLDAETEPARRRALLAGKVEDMLNTVVRQISFYDFERRLHDRRREGELLPERIGEIWMDISRESLGPAFDLDDDYAVFWCYVPHFVHVPFYVYAYAFGDCLVNALYAVYRERPEGFADKYLDLLRAGGTLRHRELLAPFGLDASDPGFWDRGLSVIEGFIDELAAA